jgi:hypothetical protein
VGSKNQQPSRLLRLAIEVETNGKVPCPPTIYIACGSPRVVVVGSLWTSGPEL